DTPVFFWKPEQEYGWASQWCRSPFSARVTMPDGEEREVCFPTAEHWMMRQKALLFGDKAVLERIARLPKTLPPKEVKALGRKVQEFDDATWVRERERIVLEGTLLKFRQHPGLLQKLLETGERELVEASPRDRIWGIGYGKARAAEVGREKWGTNLLGRALMEARRILRRDSQSAAKPALASPSPQDGAAGGPKEEDAVTESTARSD
ncbi:DUF1768-domain-containing protein, partial [Pilatotrama ljubarskyi]